MRINITHCMYCIVTIMKITIITIIIKIHKCMILIMVSFIYTAIKIINTFER
jgi:hypothetical protein